MLLATRRGWMSLAAGLAGAATPLAGLAHGQRRLFGAPVDLLVPEAAPADAVASVWRGLESIHTRFNAWKPGELLALNTAIAADRPHRVSPLLASLLRGAAALEQRSLGHFNAGIGGLVSAWGFHAEVLRPGPRPPDAERWLAARPSLAQLEIRGDRVRSSNPQLQVDLGGYAKGAALDWALDCLHVAGVHDALLNLGGNLAAMGRTGDGARPWRVGIRDPLSGGLAASLEVAGREAVVTSAQYERWRLVDGRPVGHVLDPASGRPAETLASVTVVHRSATLADAAATALLVAGPERWTRVAESLGVDQVLVIDRHGRRQATPRLLARLSAGTPRA